MDVRCAVCGEPWDIYYINHEMEEDDWDKEDFYNGKGCPCCKGNPGENYDSEYAEKFLIARELLGDDTDGFASIMEGE